MISSGFATRRASALILTWILRLFSYRLSDMSFVHKLGGVASSECRPKRPWWDCGRIFRLSSTISIHHCMQSAFGPNDCFTCSLCWLFSNSSNFHRAVSTASTAPRSFHRPIYPHHDQAGILQNACSRTSLRPALPHACTLRPGR